jgi:hypothetical protein
VVVADVEVMPVQLELHPLPQLAAVVVVAADRGS